MTKSSGTESVTLRVPTEILDSIEIIAEATDRSRSYIIVRALKTFLLNEGAHVLAAVKGQEQIASGDYEDIDDVISDMDKILAEE
eukprot:gene46412-62870_t